MEKALNECFGKDEFINYENIEQLQKPLTEIYEKLEMEELAASFD